jgi:hypothetical protein
MFRLPPLDTDPPNYAEGVVIRSAKEPPLNLRDKTLVRPLLKRKIPEFQESRFANDDWQKGKAGGSGTLTNEGVTMHIFLNNRS